MRDQLEELMMEGDLLEVALDETQHIWRILSHTNSPRHQVLRKYDELNTSGDKDSKKRGRKRKSDEFELISGVQKLKAGGAGRKGNNKVSSPSPNSGNVKRGPRKVLK